jgi:hypothetical protein
MLNVAGGLVLKSGCNYPGKVLQIEEAGRRSAEAGDAYPRPLRYFSSRRSGSTSPVAVSSMAIAKSSCALRASRSCVTW